MPVEPLWAFFLFRGSLGYIPFKIHKRLKSFKDSCNFFSAVARVQYWLPSPEEYWKKEQ